MLFGDISINGKPYRIDLATWRDKDIIDFAPRASTPGGSTVMSDLSLSQPLNQTDWRHGFGFFWYSDASGYLRTVGDIDTRQDGLVIRYTKATSSDTNNNTKSGMIAFNGAIYTWGADGLRKFNGTAWSSIYSTGAVNWAINGGTYLLFAPNGARVKKMSTADAVTDAGVDANATDYSWLVIHNGYIFAGKDGTNRIHYDNNEDLSQLEGTTADTKLIYCGLGTMETKWAVVFAGSLYVARQDGLWQLGEDLIARRVLDYSNDVSSTNFLSYAIVNGFLVFPIRDRIVQWNGARVADITPPKLSDNFPYNTYGVFKNFVSVDNFLYCTGKTTESSYDIDLLCWDGVGWHRLKTLVSASTTDDISMLAYDVVNHRLWYHLNATADATYYIPMKARSSFPYADFDTTGTHSLYTSRMDMGFRMVTKSMSGLFVEVSNVNTTQYISVYYKLDDDASWTLWDHVKTNGVNHLRFPGGKYSREFEYIKLRFDFVTASATSTPVLEGYTIRFIMRPDVAWGFNFWVVSGDEYQYGVAKDERTALQIRNELMEYRDSKAPLVFVDIYGDEHIGYITAINGQPTGRTAPDEYEKAEIEGRWNINFVEII